MRCMRRRNVATGSDHMILVAIVVAAAFASGCNTSRYGMGYDERRPELQRVAVLANVEVFSRHSGGALERRPDEEPQVRKRTEEVLGRLVQQRGCEVMQLAQPISDDQSKRPVAARLALLDAIREAIFLHHYQVGKALFFDHSAGDAGLVLTDQDVDTILCAYVTGAIPTGGRQFLKGTAVTIGILTGIHMHVSTNEVTIMLLLLDRQTGHVLWFNVYAAETSVTSERQLRQAVERAGQYLLKPRK